MRALVLLLRYSGLRIRDAATLSRNSTQGNKLFLYTAKTGTPVYCPLLPFVIEALHAIAEKTAYFFILTGISEGHAHRFRDTFSVELLLGGVPIERVSILLGHQSVRITEKHYAPWVKARQEQLRIMTISIDPE